MILNFGTNVWVAQPRLALLFQCSTFFYCGSFQRIMSLLELITENMWKVENLSWPSKESWTHASEQKVSNNEHKISSSIPFVFILKR